LSLIYIQLVIEINYENCPSLPQTGVKWDTCRGMMGQQSVSW